MRGHCEGCESAGIGSETSSLSKREKVGHGPEAGLSLHFQRLEKDPVSFSEGQWHETKVEREKEAQGPQDMLTSMDVILSNYK